MTLTQTKCKIKSFGFGKLEQRQVVADFSGGSLSSNTGLVLMAQLDLQYQITQSFARGFKDERTQNRVQHTLEDLIAQRVYGLVQGYPDLNDHEQLRFDPMFGLAVGKLESQHARCAPLAGKSTLNRLEMSSCQDLSQEQERYVKITADPKVLEQVFLDLFFVLCDNPPRRLFIDLDVTDDPVHGQQALAFFNRYYDSVCYAPLYIFCGGHLLAAKLRPSNVDPAAGALDELKRIVPQIRQRWPQVQLVVRGDSAYSRNDIMSWCEARGIDYAFGLAGNERLVRMTLPLQDKAQAQYQRRHQRLVSGLESYFQAESQSSEVPQRLPPEVWYQSLHYRTLDSWSRTRRVVCKLSYDANGPKRRFVVTSIPASKVIPSQLYTEYYCPRGDMENRIKEQQLDLFSDRTSTHEFDSNQLRLWFSSLAYVLLQALRQHCLYQTELASACVGTIRHKLLKLGAQIRVSVRRVHIAICSASPVQSLFALVHQRLMALANSS